MKSSQSIYQSREFADAWHKAQVQREDVLRTRIMNPILLRGIGCLTGCTVLDAGCGDGFFLGRILDQNPRQVYAFDVSRYLAKHAFTRFPSVNICEADLTKGLPYAGCSFDVIVCYNVLMDLPDVQLAASELARVIRPNGLVHIVIVHPLYNLFVNDRKAEKESAIDRISKYTEKEAIYVTTIPGFDNFTVYRRPISHYVNAFSEAGLLIAHMLEVPVREPAVGTGSRKSGVPVFAYFKLWRFAG